MLSRKSLDRFKQIYKLENGIDLADELAYELASKLINLYRSVYIDDSVKIDENYETKLQSTHHQN